MTQNPLIKTLQEADELFDKEFPGTNCCDSCIDDKNEGYGDDINGCCCSHSSIIIKNYKIPFWFAKDLKSFNHSRSLKLLEEAKEMIKSKREKNFEYLGELYREGYENALTDCLRDLDEAINLYKK